MYSGVGIDLAIMISTRALLALALPLCLFYHTHRPSFLGNP